MKPLALRPQARIDRQKEVRHYRDHAGPSVAQRLVNASRKALEQVRRDPAIGSPRIGELIEIPGLRSWRVAAFPLIWFYFERADCIDVVRLLGERQDILSIFGEEGGVT